MSYDLNRKNLIKLFKVISENEITLQGRYDYGDLSSFNAKVDRDYPMLYLVTPEYGSLNTDGTIMYQYNIFVVSRFGRESVESDGITLAEQELMKCETIARNVYGLYMQICPRIGWQGNKSESGFVCIRREFNDDAVAVSLDLTVIASNKEFTCKQQTLTDLVNLLGC